MTTCENLSSIDDSVSSLIVTNLFVYIVLNFQSLRTSINSLNLLGAESNDVFKADNLEFHCPLKPNAWIIRVNSLNLSVKDSSDTDSSTGSDVRISLTFDTTSWTDGTFS